MKLISFGPAGAEQPGVLCTPETILPLAPLWRRLTQPAPSMAGVVGLLLPHLRHVIDDAVDAAGERDLVEVGSVRIGPPVPAPSKIVVCGVNYRSGDVGADPPRNPVVLRHEVSGPTDDVVLAPEMGRVVSEAELVVVVGAPLRHADAHQAAAAVAGFMCGQDLTSMAAFTADVDRGGPMFLQPTRAKAVDTFCPTGPWLVTAEEVGDHRSLEIRAWVDGELRERGRAADMFTPAPELMAWLSTTMTLLPGDLIFTGAPPEVDAGAMTPLVAGETLRTAIDGLGEMTNRLVNP